MNYRAENWLIGIAILHLLISFMFMGEPVRHILASGSIDVSKLEHVERTVLYFSFGIILLIAGVVISGAQAKSRSFREIVSVVLLLVVMIWIILMPISSFWLALPPVFALVFFPPSG